MSSNSKKLPLKVKKKNKNYFTQDTEDAILEYNRTENPEKRDKIYTKNIHYPFFKLTQNIIHTFKFYNTDVDDLEQLQHRIIVFLLDKIHLYHHSKSIDDRLNKIINKKYEHNLFTKEEFLNYTNNADKITLDQIRKFIEQYEGKVNDECWKELKRLTPPKAYSYFGTIVKRWCINYNQQNYNKKLNSSPIEGLSSSSEYSYYLDDTYSKSEALSNFMDDFTEYVSENIYEIFPKKNDAQIADAILELFRKREHLELFNKKALYIFIREQGDYKTPKITKISNILKDMFEKNYIFYTENGYVDFENL